MIQKYSQVIKCMLDKSIKNTALISSLFVHNPRKDFTRNRKLPFEEVVRLLLGMGGNSLNKEILEHFNYSNVLPTASAFVQQRKKLLPDALAFIFNDFTDSLKGLKTYNGYRLLAVDGSTLQIASNKLDTDTHVAQKGTKGLNFLHLNALFDLQNKIYIDSITQPIRKKNEFKALIDMVDRSKIESPVILIGDRGYESYNNIAHIEQKGWKYLIRVKQKGHGKGILKKLQLPSNEEFIKNIRLILTRKQTKEIRSQPELYRFLAKHSTFDYLESGDKGDYELLFRVAAIRLENGKWQYFITNLDPLKFTFEDIRTLYKKRWGIETSFRELKHTLALNCFHSKKAELCQQEIFARMIMYNFCELITLRVVISKKNRKHTYQANFTMAIHICKQLFKLSVNKHPPDVEALISKFLLPVRDGRKHPRNIKYRSFVSFNYRVA